MSATRELTVVGTVNQTECLEHDWDFSSVTMRRGDGAVYLVVAYHCSLCRGIKTLTQRQSFPSSKAITDEDRKARRYRS